MDFPSGDQAGERSATAGELVRLRASPFSAGTVMMSPCASNTARAPVGEILASRYVPRLSRSAGAPRENRRGFLHELRARAHLRDRTDAASRIVRKQSRRARPMP